MELDEFLADKKNAHREQGNLSVKCNALYKTEDNLNCYLTPSQAIVFAQMLLAKVQIILDHKIENVALQVWNQGKDNEKIFVGLTKPRKGERRKKKNTTNPTTES